ncbi:MAG: WD40/YVTN/BNR-like repeat-containing protein [Bryobacteraceae bacterium]
MALAFLVLAASWRILGPGGGGAQFLPTISPHDTRTVLVRCDMTGAYVTRDAGATWRMFNLGGTVGFFAFDARDPAVVYAGTSGLWRSADTGRTWTRIYPARADIVRIDMPDDHASERILTRDGRAPRVTALLADGKTLYAGMGAALHVSRDTGATWTKLADLPGPALKVHRHGGVVYAIGSNAVTACRGDACKDLPTPGGFTAVSAGLAVFYGISPNGVHVSEDAGATWRKADFPHRAEAIATSLEHPATVYVSHGGKEAFGVAKSTDTGRTWQLTWKNNVRDFWLSDRFGLGWGSNPINLGVAPTDPNLCYATNYGATLRTTDGGASWEGVYSRRAEDGGAVTTGLDVTTCYGVHFDPFDPKRVFITYTDIGLFASENGGASWHSVSRTVPRPWVNTAYWMEFDPEVRGRVWAVMSGVHDLPRPKMWRRRDPATFNGGVVVSGDGGRTWQVASAALPPSAATHILLDPASPAASRTLYITACGRGVFKSTDGGKTWAARNQGIAGTTPLAWRLARSPDAALYLVVARRSEDGSFNNEGDGALYRSRDGAEHWERIRLPEGVNGPNGIAIDPKDPRRLYLAAWGRTTPGGAADGGIFLSTDGGANWRNVFARDQHVYDVTIDPRDPRVLYGCGFESSAWRSADRGLTWTRIPGYDFKWGHRVIPDPQRAGMIYITTFGGSVWHGPVH